MCKSDAMRSGFLKSRNGPLSASVYVNNGRNSMDDLFNANVEALAQNESGKYIDCYERIVSDPTDEVMYCGTCSEIPGRWKSGMSFCLK